LRIARRVRPARSPHLRGRHGRPLSWHRCRPSRALPLCAPRSAMLRKSAFPGRAALRTRVARRRAHVRRAPAGTRSRASSRYAESRRGFQRTVDRERDAPPALGLDPELAAALLCQTVVLGFPIVLRHAPLGGEPAFLLQAMQRRKERSRFDEKGALGQLLDPACNAQAMAWLDRERRENKQIDRKSTRLNSSHL